METEKGSKHVDNVITVPSKKYRLYGPKTKKNLILGYFVTYFGIGGLCVCVKFQLNPPTQLEVSDLFRKNLDFVVCRKPQFQMGNIGPSEVLS